MRFFRKDEIPREVHVKASLEAGEALEITVHSETTAVHSPKVRITGSGKLDVAFPVRSDEGFIAQVVPEYKGPEALRGVQGRIETVTTDPRRAAGPSRPSAVSER